MRYEEQKVEEEEHRRHWLALDEIEEKIYSFQKVKSKSMEKKLKVKLHNQISEYLRENELIYKNGIFYKTVMTSPD